MKYLIIGLFIKYINKMQRIAITCGEQSENHVGMEIHGSGLSNYGFSEKDLISWKNKFEEMGALCELYDLKDNFLKSPDIMDVIDLVDDAYILIIRNGINALLNKTDGNINNSNDMFNECLSVNWDKKYYDARRKKVLNKHARYNNCFGDTGQNADLENKKGTIVAYSDVPILNKWKTNLSTFICGDNLQAEGNLYYDVNKCGIGFHGDSERKKVIAASLGASTEIHWQWFFNSKPIGDRFKIQVNCGDIYIMSDKATGHDWKKRTKITLRHAAGCDKYVTIK